MPNDSTFPILPDGRHCTFSSPRTNRRERRRGGGGLFREPFPIGPRGGKAIFLTFTRVEGEGR